MPDFQPYKAYALFNALVDEKAPRYLPGASNRVRAQAHSAAAMAAHREFLRLIEPLGVDFDEDRMFKPGDLRNPNEWMYKAMDHANESARLGLVSRAVIVSGLHYKKYAWDLWPVLRDSCAPKYEPFLNALEEFVAWDLAAETRLRDRVDNASRLHVCAADGCGVHAMHKQGLKACGGRCSLDVKPHYCSKECQKKVSIPLASRASLMSVTDLSSSRTGAGTNLFANRTRSSSRTLRRPKARPPPRRWMTLGP